MKQFFLGLILSLTLTFIVLAASQSVDEALREPNFITLRFYDEYNPSNVSSLVIDDNATLKTLKEKIKVLIPKDKKLGEDITVGELICRERDNERTLKTLGFKNDDLLSLILYGKDEITLEEFCEREGINIEEFLAEGPLENR